MATAMAAVVAAVDNRDWQPEMVMARAVARAVARAMARAGARVIAVARARLHVTAVILSITE